MRTRYSAIAILLHWTIALLILANLLLGWRMGYLAGKDQFALFQLHKSVGISVLVLSIARLAWRLLNPPPRLPASMKPWEHRVATATHWFFYAMMIGGSIHLYLALGGAALIALHVAAALKHQFVARDGVLGRMVPGLRSTPTSL